VLWSYVDRVLGQPSLVRESSLGPYPWSSLLRAALHGPGRALCQPRSRQGHSRGSLRCRGRSRGSGRGRGRGGIRGAASIVRCCWQGP